MKRERFKISLVIMLLTAFSLWRVPSVMAQGSIFGAVHNTNQTIPANGVISFFGFINGTDDEIRTESSVGAGYDNGNWFDDFQNYLDESAGQPYQYRFFNITNGEGFVLDDIIPNNSFQQEDIQLAPVAWPPVVMNPYAFALATGKILLGWDALPDHTFHIYRRYSMSGGSFYRIDNPSGNLDDPGVAGSFYVDPDGDGFSSYDYVIIAENPSGLLGTHSAIVSVNSSFPAAPVIEAISPASGELSGGTPVTVSGSGFDTDGVIVNIGAGLLTDIDIISPSEITGLTPPGTEGAADVFVTNAESNLSSNILVGAFSYIGNQNTPPVLYGTSPKNGLTEQSLTFKVYAVDVNGDEVIISGRRLPDEATFIYSGFNTESGFYEATFTWTPGLADAGLHDSLEFLAHDIIDTTTAVVPITIFDNGYVCGDVDGNWTYNLLDIIYLIGFIYNDPPGPAPDPLEAGDANGNSKINLLDILYLIAFLYDDPPGPAPVCP